jgi:hypothetical protein
MTCDQPGAADPLWFLEQSFAGLVLSLICSLWNKRDRA